MLISGVLPLSQSYHYLKPCPKHINSYTSKKTAFEKLKYFAFEKGGNAVIGIDIDEFSGNRIGVIANGTIVEIEKI